MRIAGRLEYPTSEILTANSNKSFGEMLSEAREGIAKGMQKDLKVIFLS